MASSPLQRPPSSVAPEALAEHHRKSTEARRANGWLAIDPEPIPYACAPTLREELARVDWAAFRTAYGPAVLVPNCLVTLLEGDEQAALEVTHDLWCGLCHQHAYVSSAALPAFRFLMRALASANPQLTIELLDIILGLATVPLTEFGVDVDAFTAALRGEMTVQIPAFEAFATHDDEEIRRMAVAIVDGLRVP